LSSGAPAAGLAQRPDLGAALARHASRARIALALLALLALAAVLLALGHGPVAIAPGTMLDFVAIRLGLLDAGALERRDLVVLTGIRAPRALLGFVTGASLALAGAVLQGLFRNPLADPALIGVSSGAALGAVAIIVAGDAAAAALPSVLAPLLLPACAFLGGLAATLAVYRLALHDGRTDVATMLLAGIAINAMAGAGIGLFIFVSTDAQLRDLNFWLLGSLGAATWSALAPLLALCAAGMALLLRMGTALNALLLGERDAHHLGLDVERAKRRLIIAAALITGAVVSVTGVIGFVGLVVPHLVRLTLGPDHRVLLPASMLLGGALLLLADTAARTVVAPAELPIGILTSCIGGPFFLWLLLRRTARGAG